MSALGARLRRIGERLSRDKADTLLLMVAIVLVMAPHAAHLPLWASLCAAATLVWRASITLRGKRMPSTPLLLVAALSATGGVLAEYHTIFGRDAGVAMVVLLMGFKTLEMKARRDLFVVTFLGFVVILTNFFYSQSIPMALAMIAAIVATLTAQISFQYQDKVPPLAQRLRLGATMFGLAAPLALLLFVIFPRVQGPLWGMPRDAHGARSGLSDSMSPGLISSLAQSDEVAFRAEFSDPVPTQADLYWRGLVLARYDGRTWTTLPRERRRPTSTSVKMYDKGVRYRVTMESNNNNWIFALDIGGKVPELNGLSVVVSPELEFIVPQGITERVRYDTISYPKYGLEPDRLLNRAVWTALPSGGNVRTMALAQKMAAAGDPAARVNAVMTMFRQQGYVYTLEPPLLGEDAVDEFLFDTRAGFCEHYAGAFVFLMRAMDVPARVVLGYQGGEMNPLDGFMTVRQSDAHAWAEVWLAGRGWTRIDPTAAVAPDRVTRNLARALPPRPPFGISSLNGLMNFDLGKDSLLGKLRFTIAAINNGWNQWALNYTPGRQRELLNGLGPRLWTWSNALALVMMGALIWLVRWRLRQRRIDPADRMYLALCALWAQRGLARAPDEAPRSFGARLAQAAPRGPAADAAVAFLALYSDYKYGRAPGADLIPTLKKLFSASR